MTNNSLLSQAKSLRELIESEADGIEQECTMSPAVVDALAKEDLFKIMVPASLGGLEASIEDIIDVHEELSYADGSVGWAFAQNTTCMAYSAYMSKECAEKVVNGRAAAGMFAPLGTIEKEGDQYKVSGNYMFGSGCGHADHIGGVGMYLENGEMVFDGELPIMLAYFVPAENAELKGNWDVMGLRGTGSYDFAIPEQMVDEGTVFSYFTRDNQHGGSFYKLGPAPIGTVNSVAWAIGVGKRALDEITAIAKNGRARLGVTPLKEQQTFQRDLGYHTVALDAARRQVKATYQAAVEAFENNESPEVIEQLLWDTKASGNYAVQVAKDAASFAFEASGSHGLRNPNKLQRCFRDLCVGSVHQVFDPRNYNEHVKVSLGLENSPF